MGWGDLTIVDPALIIGLLYSSCYTSLSFVHGNFQDLILISRHLLQLHHDDGGEQRGVDGGGAQLPPQDRGDPRDADVGPQCLSPVASVDSSDGPAEGKNHQEDDHDVKQTEGAGVEGEGLQKPDGQRA